MNDTIIPKLHHQRIHQSDKSEPFTVTKAHFPETQARPLSRKLRTLLEYADRQKRNANVTKLQNSNVSRVIYFKSDCETGSFIQMHQMSSREKRRQIVAVKNTRTKIKRLNVCGFREGLNGLNLSKYFYMIDRFFSANIKKCLLDILSVDISNSNLMHIGISRTCRA